VDESLEGDYLEPESLGGVNLNAASVAQLMTLDGVSAGLAEAIVSYRQAHGPFVSIFDIASVPRLGRGTFRRISGMPYSDTRKHRRHKLAQLLGMSARDVGDLRLVASGICRMSGVAGCLLSDPDGMLMAESGATSYAAPMSAVIPRMFRLIYENMAVASVGEVNSLSLCVKERLYTIVAGARFCLTVVHQTSRLTHTQITTIQKLAAELDWLLSHRGYIGRSGV
jgi:competence ComEA-like helix-hairpin-helix protein